MKNTKTVKRTNPDGSIDKIEALNEEGLREFMNMYKYDFLEARKHLLDIRKVIEKEQIPCELKLLKISKIIAEFRKDEKRD